MEEEKIAFVFDTNFIIKNQQLREVLGKIDKKYVPYVTQVSIEERKAQQCSEKRKAYRKIKEVKKQIPSLIHLKNETELEKEIEQFKEQVQCAYETHFAETIIKYKLSPEWFENILSRAFQKIPPFNDDDNASDKGFKDSLMWISINEYFKNNGENEVVFLTDDKGFLKQADILTKEFEEYTGKKIQIMNNSSFGSLLENTKENEPAQKKDIPNIESIREQLRDILESICWVTEYNDFGDESTDRGFLTNKQFDEMYIREVMEALESIIFNHMFNEQIKISIFLDRDDRIFDDKSIDISVIERLNKLYQDTLKNYPDYIPAFINAVMDRFNENFVDTGYIVDPEVPF